MVVLCSGIIFNVSCACVCVYIYKCGIYIGDCLVTFGNTTVFVSCKQTRLVDKIKFPSMMMNKNKKKTKESWKYICRYVSGKRILEMWKEFS